MVNQKKNKMRQQALTWYRSLYPNTWTYIVMKWQTYTTHPGKNWPIEMVTMSDNAIERIYREVELEEKFNQ